MASYDKLRERDRLEREQSNRGTTKIYDGTHSYVDPINVRFLDNGTVKCAVLSDEAKGNMLYLQGYMVEELYKEWKLKLGTFGPSDSFLEKEDATLHDVKLTTKQLGILHKLIEWETENEKV